MGQMRGTPNAQQGLMGPIPGKPPTPGMHGEFLAIFLIDYLNSYI